MSLSINGIGMDAGLLAGAAARNTRTEQDAEAIRNDDDARDEQLRADEKAALLTDSVNISQQARDALERVSMSEADTEAADSQRTDSATQKDQQIPQ